MKQKLIRWVAASLCLFILLIILPVRQVSSAEAPQIDLNQTASLKLCEISCTTSQPIAGVELTLYRVAEYKTCNADSLALLKEYSACGIDINDLSTSEKQISAAGKAMVYIMTHKLSGITAVSDKNGVAEFDNLPLGLYLVKVCSHKARVKVASDMFFIYLPMYEKEGGWRYNIVAQPKSVFSTEGGEIVTTTRTARKIWDDEGNSQRRPPSVQVGLYRDGILVDVAVLNEVNNWSYSWSGLSDNFKWSVKELAVPKGYTASVKEGDTITTITNTYKPPTDQPRGILPLTGDSEKLIFMCSAAAAVCVIFFAAEVVIRRRKKKSVI
ncbi:Cna B-type domain-containing protein [[Clostridium] cellulosi]